MMEADRPTRTTSLSKLTAVSAKPVSPGTTQHLSPADHLMALHSMHLIFYHTETPFGSSDLETLRVSLSEVLSAYPPVTGRLTRGRDGGWDVKCNDAGVRLLRAKVASTVEEWLRTADGSEERDLTIWEDMPEDPSIWSPFRIQVNLRLLENHREGTGREYKITVVSYQKDQEANHVGWIKWFTKSLKSTAFGSTPII